MLRLAYHRRLVSLPGSGSDASVVRSRVKDTPANAIVAVSSRDYALRAVSPAPRRHAGANFGSVTSSVTSSNTTFTGIPMRIACGGTPTRLELNFAPSTSFTTTTA
jgi:hypothetical protein